MAYKEAWSLLIVLFLGTLALAAYQAPTPQPARSLPSVTVVWNDPLAGQSPANLSVLLPAQQPSPKGSSPPGANGPSDYLFANSGSSYYWAGGESFAPSVMSNTGIQASIQVISAQVSGCLSFWVADEMSSNSVWGQVGYYICNGVTPVAFYQIWTSGTVTVTGTTSVVVGSHEFSMYLSSGTTWAYALDGAVFGSYNMGSSVSSSNYPVEALSEEGYVGSSWNPPQVSLSQIQVQSGGVWSQVSTAFEPYGCGGSSYSCWGVQGNRQDSLIPPGAMAVGGATPAVASGTTLWLGSGTTTSTTSLLSTTSSASSTSASSATTTYRTSSSATSTSSSVSTSSAISTSSSSSTLASTSTSASSTSSVSSLSSTSVSTSTPSVSTQSAALQESLAISPTSVPQKSTVYFTVAVTDGQGAAVGGASVSLTIFKPDGKSVTVTATTNSAGQAYFQYKVSAAAKAGTYSVSAVAVMAGYANAVVSGTFTVV